MQTSATIDDRIDAWLDAGLIDADQAAAIRAWEGRHAGSGTDGGEAPIRDRMAATIGIVGGLVLGLGVLLTVAANWDSVSDLTKLALVCATMLAAYGAGALVDRRGAARWAGTVGYVVGALTFAGGVFLVGQVFNVRAHDPLGWLVAAIATSVVAVVTTRRAVGTIAAVAWLAWAGHELVLALDASRSLGAAVSAVGAGALLAIAAYGIGWLLDAAAASARSSAARETILPSLVADLDALSVPLRAVSLLALAGLLVPVSFAWHASDEPLDGGLGVAVIAGTVIATAVAVAVARFAPLQSRRALAVGLGTGSALILLASLIGSMTLAGVIANVLLGAGGFALCALGLRERLSGAFTAGVAWLVLLIAARYIDMMLTTALGGLGFIGAGLVLIGCGWLVGRSRQVWNEQAVGE